MCGIAKRGCGSSYQSGYFEESEQVDEVRFKRDDLTFWLTVGALVVSVLALIKK